MCVCVCVCVIPKEPEVIYLSFLNRIIRIILTKKGWHKRHFIDQVATRKKEKISIFKKNTPRHISFVK